jgi:hypothetical protein
VYVVVAVGEAFAVLTPVGTAPVDHEYVVAPLAVIVAVPPLQMLTLVAVTSSVETIVTVACAVSVHVPVVPVTVYVVVVTGDASAVLVPVGVAPADHVYEVAPLAVSVAVPPGQMLAFVAVTVRPLITVTVA